MLPFIKYLAVRCWNRVVIIRSCARLGRPRCLNLGLKSRCMDYRLRDIPQSVQMII